MATRAYDTDEGPSTPADYMRAQPVGPMVEADIAEWLLATR